MEDRLVDYLLSNYTFNPRGETHCLVNGNRRTLKQFKDEYVLNPQILKAAECRDVAFMVDEEQGIFFSKVIDKLKNKYFSQKKESINSLDVEGSTRLNMDNYFPIVDVESARKMLLDSRNNRVSQLNYVIWEDQLTKESREMYRSVVGHVILRYNPYDITSLQDYEFEGQTIKLVNTYLPPIWRESPISDAEIQNLTLPNLVDGFLHHLFPDEKVFKFVMNWMYNALMLRNETYLVLNGKKGIGKGVFCSLLRSLVGHCHYTEAPTGFLTSDFNAVLEEKRVIVLDELRVDRRTHIKLKKYINKYQNIEKKGVDVQRAKETFNSFVICNNDLSDMYVEADDRRFSVPELTEKPLSEIWDESVTSKFIAELENEESELVKVFGNYVLHYGQDSSINEFDLYKGVRFFELVRASLTSWQQFILDTILEEEEEEVLKLSTLRRRFNSDSNNMTFPNAGRVGDFLRNYKHLGEGILGELIKDGRDYFIEINTYWQKSVDTTATSRVSTKEIEIEL